MNGKVQTIDALDPSHVSMNVNIYRQRELSHPQKMMVRAASIIAAGDLDAIKAQVKAARLYNCTVSEGAYEVEGAEASRCEWYKAHAVRITASSRRQKKPWIELVYDSAADAKAVIAAVNS